MSSKEFGKLRCFSSTSKAAKAETLLAPDSNGISKEVPIEQFEEHGLGFGNGGDWLRKDGSFCKKYLVDIIRSDGYGNKIVAVRTIGFATAPANRSSIPQEVRTMFRGSPCPVLGTSTNESEIDHKDGYSSSGCKFNDFQPLSKAANDAKRNYCKSCRETGKRFDARRLGFKVGWISGTPFYTKESKCKGCYWNDVILFHQTISKSFKNDEVSDQKN